MIECTVSTTSSTNPIRLVDHFNFKLLDCFSPSQSNQDMNVTVRSQSLEEDEEIKEMNTSILRSVEMYNETLSRLSRVNETVDNLDRNHEKIKQYATKISDNLKQLQTFVENHLHQNDLTESVHSVLICLNEFIRQTNLHVMHVYRTNKDEYDAELNKLNQLKNILHIVKKNKHACPICLQQESTHFTVPCGHVFCKECADKIKLQCFVCRQYVLKVSSLFYT